MKKELEEFEQIGENLNKAVELVREASIKANVLSGEMLKRGKRDLNVEFRILREEINKVLVNMERDLKRNVDMWIVSIRKKLKEVL